MGFVMIAFTLLVSGRLVRCGRGTMEFGGLCVTFFAIMGSLIISAFHLKALYNPSTLARFRLRRQGQARMSKLGLITGKLLI